MPMITLKASDGFEPGAYRADPEGPPRGGVVVIQEIFGVNEHIRSICDRLAADGYAAVAPALFDRTVPGFECGYTPADVEHARTFIANPNWDEFMRDTEAARDALAGAGKTGIVGFCLGGSVAFSAATRSDGFSAAVGFYGGRIASMADEQPRCPVQLHYGSEDQGIPMSNVDTVRAKRPDVDIFVYEGAQHGFNCDARASYHPEAAKLAWDRTMKFLADHLA